MESKIALRVISIISFIGILFSGYLTFTEMSAKASCTAGGCMNILGLPTCFYGLVMYVVVFTISLLGQK